MEGTTTRLAGASGTGPTAARRATPAELATLGRRARIALLDDHEVLLDSIRSWIRFNAPDFDVVIAATTWLQLMHSPDFPTELVFIDVQLREPVSLEARVRTCLAAGAKVIVLTGLDTSELRERSLAAGASAFVSKAEPLEEVLEIARRVVGLAPAGQGPEPEPAFQRPRLSVGEEEALRLYVSGHSTNEVAEAMNVRFETAKTYLRRVREKYAKVQRPASRRSDLIQRATEDGYLR